MTWTKESIDDVKRASRLEDVIGRETKLTKDGDDLVGCCCMPAHQDDTPSLRVSPKKQLWRCHGCGLGGDVIAFLNKCRGMNFVDAMKSLSAETGVALVEAAVAERRKVAAYDYRDAAGAVLFTIERWEPGKNGRTKDFVQKLPSGEAKKSTVQVLYRLPEVIAAVVANDVVFVTEGEKACEALVKLGVCATTHAGGSSAKKTWSAEFVAPLKGARVVLLPDNDDVGAEFMRHVAGVLGRVAADIRTVSLPVTGKGDDAFEWVSEGGSKEALLALSTSSPAQAGSGSWQAGLRYVGRFLVGSAANLELILENDPLLQGVFAFDEFATRITVVRAPPWRERGAVFPRTLLDHDVTRLGIYLERTYGTAFQGIGAVVSSIADRAAFNPLTGWLSSLKWDGKERLSTWLQAFAGAEDTPYTRAVARAWCISAVARAFSPGCQVDHTIVLEGDQGLGKSSLLRALVGKEWFLDHLPDFSSKDAAILVGRAWVHELAELATLSKAEVEKIKQFLSQRDDVFRPPYGTNTKEVPRKCVFAATTNRDDYLRDTTGNRRFWPIVTRAIDVAGVAAAREQLWAEAVAAFRAGEGWHLTVAADRAAAVVEQEQRLERDPWHARIAEYCAAQARRPITLDEVLAVVGVELAKRAPRDASRTRDILRQLRWRETRPRAGAAAERPRIWVPPPDPDDGPGGPSGPDNSGNSGGSEKSQQEAARPSGPSGPLKNGGGTEPYTTNSLGLRSPVVSAVSLPSQSSFSLGQVGPIGPRASGSPEKWSGTDLGSIGPLGPDSDSDINETWGGDR